MLELLAAADPPSFVAWAILALAAGMYPVGLVLGSPCGCCDCKYRVEILPAGFEGAVVNDCGHPELVDLFIRSASYELEGGRPSASATAIEVAPGLTLVSDTDHVELTYTQASGKYLRMTFEGTNSLLDSDDTVSLTVDANTLDDTLWPEEPLGRDYLPTIGTWDVRIVKPAGPCKCRECYCGQDRPFESMPDAPVAYTLQFIEGFSDPESEWYGPELPIPFSKFAPLNPSCAVDLARWAEPFSLKKMTGAELVALNLGGFAGELVYMSDPIPWGGCNSWVYFYFPCGDDGFGWLAAGYWAPTWGICGATGTRIGWKAADYHETPSLYRDDLFGSDIDFGIATLTAAESHTPDATADCGTGNDGKAIATWCAGVCPHLEVTVDVTLNTAGKFNRTDLVDGTYTLDLVPEESSCGVLTYKYQEGSSYDCRGFDEPEPTLGFIVQLTNFGCDCGEGDLTWGIAGLTTKAEAGAGGLNVRWDFGSGQPDVYDCVSACAPFSLSYPAGGGYPYTLQFFYSSGTGCTAPGGTASPTGATVQFSAG